MTDTYTYHEPVDILVRDGGYLKAIAEITYRVVWPYPASYGQLPEEATADIQSVRLMKDGAALDLPAWMSDLITLPDTMERELLDHAFKEREAARDDAADHQRQTMRESAERSTALDWMGW